MFLVQAAIAHGQTATPVAADPDTEAVVAPPPYKQLRYLSLGGEARPFFEWFRNEEWGSVPGDDG
jgi:hypothetical protein